MTLRFQCTNCGKIVAIDDSEAGQAVACGSCNKAVVVPKSVAAPGSVIGDFVIDQEIGSGGVATVYRAHQLSLDRPAALKILHQQYVNDPEYLENFLEEARAAAQLNHPHIVQAYAVGEDQGCHYFAMEYIEGTTLKSVLAHSGRLVTDKALAITEQIAEALEFAWQSKELVHRDIKPDNIILTKNGDAKLADLGLAKFGKDFLTDKHATEVMGTPQYIAPEVLLGKDVDQKTDIYSLGATLYHVVTGRFPYQADSAPELARKHVTESLKPAREVVPEVPEAVSQIIQKMMAKRPPHRYQSASELIDDIKLYKNGKAIKHPPKPEFQNAINLNKVDEELAGRLPLEKSGEKKTPRKSTDGKSTGKKKGGQLKLSAAKSKGKATGKETPKAPATGKDESAEPTEKTKKSQTATPSPSDKPRGKSTGKLKTSGKAKATKRPAKTGAKRKKKKSGGNKLGLFLFLFAFIGLAAVIGIFIASQYSGEPSKYPPDQTEELRRLELMVKRDRDYDKVLERGLEIQERFSDAEEEYLEEVKALISPALEKELRALREQEHEQEYTRWQRQAKELRREEQEKQAMREWKSIQRRLEREQQLDRQERERQREETISRLEKQQKELREDALELCREHNFGEAEALFIGMKNATIDEFKDWARMKERTIRQAEEAYKLVSRSGDVLEDARIKLEGKIRPGRITSITSRNINAVYTENIYEGGELVREETEELTRPVDDLDHDELFDLMEESAERQGLSDDKTKRLLGSYLLATGRELDEAMRMIQSAEDRDTASLMLEEIDIIKELL